MVLPKTHFFGWILFHHCLPTNLFLFQRGCNSAIYDICPFCSEPKTLDHTIMFCRNSNMVWWNAFRWLGINLTMPSFAFNFLSHWQSYFKSGLCPKFATSLWFIIAWSIWKKRNKFVFEGIPSSEDLFILGIYFCWFLFKCKGWCFFFLVWGSHY